MNATFFDGCKVFASLGKVVGLDVNSTNYFLTILLSLVLAKIFSIHFKVKKVGVDVRSIYILFWGLFICYFMFGKGIIHPIVMSLINYLIILYAEDKMISMLCFIISLLYLLVIHLLRYFYVTDYTMDVTSVLMVMVQKCCLLGFAISDGKEVDEDKNVKKKSKLKPIKEIPEIHMYLSYMFNFHNLLTGPSFEFVDFKNYLEGTHYRERKDKKSNLDDVINQKIVFGFLSLAVYMIFKNYTCDKVLQPHIYSLPFFKWLMVCQMSIIIIHCRYFFAWFLADAICNIAEFGFNGYDDISGEERWNLCTNVDPMKIEFSSSLKDTIDNWNIGTCKWLRITVYNRLPESSRTYATFALSAIWHGFYPGYYIAFITVALFTSASRTFRRYIRPFFIKSEEAKKIYDIFTCIVTRLAIIYGGIPFTLESFYHSFLFLKEFFFCGHIISLAIIYLLPIVGDSWKKEINMEISKSPIF
uniref:Membrane-bound O-acyltransferase (MBOAT ) family protein n=1 Tax=Parastrongyloides trichosuri TaxID=131310 RepID=A0A0N4ZDE6_PARTI